MGTVKYSGPVTSFHCPTEATIRSLKVHFSPKQLGEGTPSPENVREIVGWDGVEIKHSRSNLLPAGTHMRTQNGITFTYYPNGDVHIEGTATGDAFLNVPTSMYFSIKPGKYTLSGNVSNSNVAIYIVVSPINGGDIGFRVSSGSSTKEITFTDDSARVQISVVSGRTVNITVHPRLEIGDFTELDITNYEFGVLGKNKFDGEYPDIKNSTNLTYRSIYVGNQIITASSNMPKTAEHQWSNLFILPGQVTSGAATGTNDFNIEVSRTITPVDGWITIAYRNEEGVDPREYQVQLEFGSTATTYEPYDPNKTVYGGWVDLISGEVCATHSLKTLNGSEQQWIWSSSLNGIPHITIDSMKSGTWYSDNCAVCDTAVKVNASSSGALQCLIGYNSNRIYFYNTTSAISGVTDLNSFTNWLSTNNISITYPLETPNTYSLAPTSLQTFLAQNNIWPNADYVEVEYDLHETQSILARKQFIMASQPHVESASGTIATFETDLAAPLKECKVYFNPVQDTSNGVPSPDNICPISGWENIEVHKTGENLISSNDIITNAYVRGAVTATGTVVGSVNNVSGYSCTDYIKVRPNSTYTIEFTWNNAAAAGLAFYEDKTVESCISGIPFEKMKSSPYTFITPENCNYIRFTTHSTKDFMSLTQGEVPVINKIYSGVIFPITFPSEAGTIYGGYVDLVKGEIVQEWEIVKIADLNWNNYSAKIHYYASLSSRERNTYIYTDTLTPRATGSFTQEAVGELTYYGEGTTATYKYIWTKVPEAMEATEANEWIKSTYADATICYKLETPIHYTLTPTQLKTLRGTNNIWASNGGDNIELSYWKH